MGARGRFDGGGRNALPLARRDCNSPNRAGTARVDVNRRLGFHAAAEAERRGEAACVSRAWVYEAARTGKIPSVRLGDEDGPLRFVAADIEQCLPNARLRGCRGSGPRNRHRAGQARVRPACEIASSVASAPAARTRRSRCP